MITATYTTNPVVNLNSSSLATITPTNISSGIKSSPVKLNNFGALDGTIISNTESAIFSLADLIIPCNSCSSLNNFIIIKNYKCLNCDNTILTSVDLKILNMLNVYIKTKRNSIPWHLKTKYFETYNRKDFSDWLDSIEYELLKAA